MLIREFLSGLDDRVKAWMALTAGIAAMYIVDIKLQAGILCISMILCYVCGAKKFTAGLALVVGFTSLLVAVLMWLTPATQWASMRVILFMIIKYGPMFAMMMFVQQTLNTGRFIRSLERMHVPARLVIPLGVSLRFMPSVIYEFRQIRYAMQIRGIRLTPSRLLRRPFETISYMMVPLLVRSLTIGNELARAAIARGIETAGRKTSLYEIVFRVRDYVMLAIWTMAIIAVIYTDNVLYAQITEAAV
jgi:energy-coupling factor transport system permease protein